MRNDFTSPVVGPISLIAIGTAVSSYNEVNLHPRGLKYFLISAATEAFRIVMMQKLLGDSSMSAIEGMYYISPACALTLLLCLLGFELDGLRSHGLQIIKDNAPIFLLASTLGFFVNMTTLMFVNVAGSLTFKVVGAMKSVVVILLGVVLFGDTVTPLQAFGYLLALVGFALYNRAQAQAQELATPSRNGAGGQPAQDTANKKDT